MGHSVPFIVINDVIKKRGFKVNGDLLSSAHVISPQIYFNMIGLSTFYHQQQVAETQLYIIQIRLLIYSFPTLPSLKSGNPFVFRNKPKANITVYHTTPLRLRILLLFGLLENAGKWDKKVILLPGRRKLGGLSALFSCMQIRWIYV